MKKSIGIICVLLLSFFAVKPLFSNGYFPMHDDTQVARVVVMGRALQEGQFPVRMVSDLGYGYGYPIFNFYGPLPYYIGGGLYALGVDSVAATKIMFGIGALLAPVALFLFLEPIFGLFAGIAGACLFMYAPYHAVQIYVRGSVGEYWAIGFVPLLLYGISLVLRKDRFTIGIVIGGVSLAAIITSHTILGFLTTALCSILVLSYLILTSAKKKFRFRSFISLLSLVALGLGLSGFFWLPAFFELSFTSVSRMIATAGSTFFDHFVCASQLWNSPWGFGGSAPGCIDGMSFKLGKVHILLAFVSVMLSVLAMKKHRFQEKQTIFTINSVVLVITIVLMLPVSAFFWQVIPYTSFIQYPWRLLAFAMLFLSISGAYVISVFRIPIVRIGLMLVVVLVTILVNAKIFVPQYLYTRDLRAFETPEELRFTKSKISDEYLPPGIIKPQRPSDIVKTAFQGTDIFMVRTLTEIDTLLRASIESTVGQEVTIKKAWFPGWEIRVNNREVNPYVVDGLPRVNIPGGMSIIEMRFINTPVRTMGNILSISSLLISIGVLYVNRKKTNA